MRLYLFLVGLTAFFSLLIAALDRRLRGQVPAPRAETSIGARIHGGMALEIAWTVIPLLICLGIFVLGAGIFFAMASRPPRR